MGDAAAGSVEFFLGPMFSEKTTSVGRELKRARLGGLACVLVKSATDVRDGPGLAVRTHGGETLEASPAAGGLGRLRVVEAPRLLGVELSPDELDVGVDEGQFFPDLRAGLDRWAREGRRVYVAALDGDFRREPFPSVAAALPLATRIVKLSAVCTLCGPPGSGRRPAEANFTVRLAAAGALAPGEFDVGAEDKYKAACLGCYLRHAARAAEAPAEPSR